MRFGADAWCGIALTNLPLPPHTVNPPVWFSLGGEGFHFSVRTVTGRNLFRIGRARRLLYVTRKLWTRKLRLYGYHAMLLAFSSWLRGAIANRAQRPGHAQTSLDFYFLSWREKSIPNEAM